MQAAAASMSVQQIPLDAIDVLPNPRTRVGDLSELVASIRANGVLTPARTLPVTSDGRYPLVYGQRRFLAAREAGLTHLPALVAPMAPEEVLQAQLIENGQREDVHPMEEAEAFQVLSQRFGRSIDEVASAVSKPRSYVLLRLKLCDLCAAARKAFYADRFNLQVAYLLARIPHPDLQVQALEAVLQGRYDRTPLTTREVQELVQRKFMLVLQHAPFDRRDGTLVPDAGACGPCPKRTGNQRELFGDVSSKEVCTDPTCYAQKTEAAWTRRAELALARGKEVLDEAASKELFPYGTKLAHNAPWVDLSERCAADPKGRTWGQLMRKAHVPITVARDTTNRAHELVPKQIAAATLKSLGYEFAQGSPASVTAAPLAVAERQRRAQLATKASVSREAIGQVVAKAEATPAGGELWRLLVQGLLQGSWHDSIQELVRRRGLTVKGERPQETLSRFVESASPEQLLGVAVEIILCRGAFWRDGYGTLLTQACAHYGVDIAGIEAQLNGADAPETAAAPPATAA